MFHAIGKLIFDILHFQGGRCGIYGANCTEWIISMEVFVYFYMKLINDHCI